MKIVQISELALAGPRLIRFARFRDERGYFTETFRRSDFEQLDFLAGLEFAQCNESHSRAGVARGLHFQWSPQMGKLVRTVHGRMIDLVLDVRRGSATEGQAIAVDMTANPEGDGGQWIWVPPGFAHGNLFPEPTTIEYFCTGEYSPGHEAGISPLAPDIDWSLCDPELYRLFEEMAPGLTLSEKDRDGLSVAAWQADERSRNFVYGEC